MAISSTHNLATMKAEKTSFVNSISEAKTTENLASDSKVSQEKDIAASLQISERMRRQYSGTKQNAQNAQEDTNLYRTADSTLEKVSRMRHQINGLSMKAVGDASSVSDRQAIQQEINQLLREIDKIRGSVRFNKKKGADADRDGEEIAKNANSSILEQPTQSMLAQANQQPGFVMQLLQ